MTVGAQLVGYRTLAEGLANLTLSMARMPVPSLPCALLRRLRRDLPLITVPTRPKATPNWRHAHLLERWLVRDIEGRFDDTLLALFADHGQVHASPPTTVYINNLPTFRRLRPLLRTDQGGAILAPGGSCRDFFVYAQENHIAEAQAILTGMVAGRAEVKRVDELVQAGFLGRCPWRPCSRRGRATWWCCPTLAKACFGTKRAASSKNSVGTTVG